jgi:hypothetical protein
MQVSNGGDKYGIMTWRFVPIPELQLDIPIGPK